MLVKLRELTGRIIEGKDGELGKIRSACFDNQLWTVRYFILSAGENLGREEVPVSTAAVPDQDFGLRLFCTGLSSEQVRRAPAIDFGTPASLLEERAVAEYYGWPRYWEHMADPHGSFAERSGGNATCAVAERQGPGLYDTRVFTGYRVIASDGEAGVLDDYIADSSSWRIKYFVVDTMTGPVRKILVSPRWAININPYRSEIHINIAQGLLTNGPEYDPAVPLDARFERRFCEYYGLPENWC